MQFGFTLLSNQIQDQSGKSSSCIACLAVSQPRGCSPPNITVSLVFFKLHQFAFVARQSFLYRCAKELNKAMHILNGNTVAKGPTWRRRNRLSPSTHFLFGTYNVGGLQDSTKRIRLAELQADVLGLTETHLQSHLEHSESMLFPEYSCFWSRNPDDRHFRGISLCGKLLSGQVLSSNGLPTAVATNFMKITVYSQFSCGSAMVINARLHLLWS